MTTARHLTTPICQRPGGCENEATAWYRILNENDEGEEERVLILACTEHAREARDVQPWQLLGRGVIHNGVAEGSGR